MKKAGGRSFILKGGSCAGAWEKIVLYLSRALPEFTRREGIESLSRRREKVPQSRANSLRPVLIRQEGTKQGGKSTKRPFS